MYLLQLSNLAQRDMAEAAGWYQRESPAIQRKFAVSIEEAFIRIVENPYKYALIGGDIRRAGMYHFPYSAFFNVENWNIRIKAILHDHRDPSIWEKRT